jgi:glutamate/tyrosine decarboxylase-like PLP-dependent enzyme
MEDVFQNGNAAYLTSGEAGSGSHDDDDSSYLSAVQTPLNIGIENSRRFRALPVYATLTAYGHPGYLAMLKRQIGLARRVTRWLIRDGRFEVLPGERAGESEGETVAKTFMVVLFRVRDRGEGQGQGQGQDPDPDHDATRLLAKRINLTGKMYITGTVWEGRSAARIAVSNWQANVDRDGALIEEVLNEVVGALGRSGGN